jgi:hypothetical protein
MVAMCAASLYQSTIEGKIEMQTLGLIMPDSRPPVDGQSTITSIAAGRRNSGRLATAIAQSPDQDLLVYMGAMLAQVEAMAVAAEMEGLADLLGCTRREVERTASKFRSPS